MVVTAVATYFVDTRTNWYVLACLLVCARVCVLIISSNTIQAEASERGIWITTTSDDDDNNDDPRKNMYRLPIAFTHIEKVSALRRIDSLLS